MPDSTTTESTFDAVADIIAETSSIERDKITMQSHTINDLGIDSLDFLDITFAIDKRFGIKMPVEQWMEDVNEGRASADEFFVMSNLVAKIDELIAAKACTSGRPGSPCNLSTSSSSTGSRRWI